MRTKDLFNRLVDFFNKQNIFFNHKGQEVGIEKIRFSEERGLKLFFHNGMSYVVKGIQGVRDTIAMPFDAILQMLYRVLPQQERYQTRDTIRPVIIPLFSLFSLLSIVGLFSFIKIT